MIKPGEYVVCDSVEGFKELGSKLHSLGFPLTPTLDKWLKLPEKNPYTIGYVFYCHVTHCIVSTGSEDVLIKVGYTKITKEQALDFEYYTPLSEQLKIGDPMRISSNGDLEIMEKDEEEDELEKMKNFFFDPNSSAWGGF